MEKRQTAIDQAKTESAQAAYSTRPARLPSARIPSIGPIRGRGLLPLLVILCLVVGFGGGWLGARSYNHASNSTTTAVKQRYITDESQVISSIAKDIGQSVVSIDAKSQVNSTDLLGIGRQSTQESAGTGFIISPDGIIMTNRHVVPAGTDSVSVTMANGTTYDNVKVIGRTSESNPLDVAFLKINNLKGNKLTPVRLGDSSKMQVGARVVAIGNALGQFQNTVTSGIISGYGRDVVAGDQTGSTAENLTDLFQTDAAINEGNSGGPLVNINSEVIGLNTAVASGAQNIGFAIPINDVRSLVNSILTKGELQQPYLGVRYVSLTNDLAAQFNLKVNRGAYLVSSSSQPAIQPGSPAEKVGLREGDVITKVNSITIDDKTSLAAALSRFKVGEQVSLSIFRDGKNLNIKATLATTPNS